MHSPNFSPTNFTGATNFIEVPVIEQFSVYDFFTKNHSKESVQSRSIYSKLKFGKIRWRKEYEDYEGVERKGGISEEIKKSK